MDYCQCCGVCLMPAPVLTFFNNKGWVGKTSLVYHLAWMLSEIGERVLACDLDPQANLTATFLDEDQLESLWKGDPQNLTIYQCIRPLTEVGDLRSPRVHQISDMLGLIPGDLALSSFEDSLSNEWPNALGESIRHYRSLVPMGQESRKPVFHLKSADGAIGAHAEAVGRAYDDFKTLANKIRRRIGLAA